MGGKPILIGAHLRLECITAADNKIDESRSVDLARLLHPSCIYG